MTITAEIPRPRIDAVTAWRAGQIAHAEHRSLSNALFVLVAEAWDARMDAKLKELAPNMPRGIKSAS